MDEPESALSPERQLDLLAMLAEIQRTGSAQVILEMHAPILMAVPDARLLHLDRLRLKDVRLEETRHFRLFSAFCQDPHGFVAAGLEQRASRGQDD